MHSVIFDLMRNLHILCHRIGYCLILIISTKATPTYTYPVPPTYAPTYAPTYDPTYAPTYDMLVM